MARLIYKILSLKNLQRKLFLFLLDNIFFILSFFLAYFLRLELFLINEAINQTLSFGILYLIFLFLSFSFSFYRPLSRYYDLYNIFKVILVFFLYAVLGFLVFNNLKIAGIPRSIGVLHPILFLVLFITSRTYIFYLIIRITKNKAAKNIVVCCSSKSLDFFKNTLKSYNILLFIINDSNFESRLIGNIPISNLDNINSYSYLFDKVNCIFLDQELNRERFKNKILKSFKNKNKIEIKVLPKIENFLDYKFKEDINNIDLFKKKINFSTKKLNDKFKDSQILITGAGGSIGGQLLKEIIKLGPRKVILIENSEYNLYKTLEEVNHLKKEIKFKTLINYFLISSTNYKKIKNICVENKINFIFHCAAFKHVPIVENNIIESLENNYLSTLNLCKIALEQNISKLILISSDKAVRPSSIMGSTKRLSELAIKYYAIKSNKLKKKTSFSAVRFANVLNSSGSVVPLFIKQIQVGGPITITDKNVERYFMTILDAVKLVLETTLISKNGNIMLLKMGKQIKILKIAHKLLNFYGKTIRSDQNPDGDVEIVEIGLRPGEKLSEELYYDSKTKKTKNKDILCVDNIKLNIVKFKKLNNLINICISKNDIRKLRTILLDQKNML